MPGLTPANYAAYCKASWTYGNDAPIIDSTYHGDFNKTHASRRDMVNREPVKRFPKSDRRVKNPLLGTPPSSPTPREQVKRDGPQRHKTAISLGNDSIAKVTAYQDFAGQLQYGNRVVPCVPKQDNDLISTPYISTAINKRCGLNDDFSFFGSTLHNSVYKKRLDDLNSIKQIHTSDSVDRSLLGRRRKMLTRSMIDYKHPMESLKGCNIKNLMVMQISPLVRADSIWSTVNNGGRNSQSTEASVNFGWPHASKGMRRFYKGSNWARNR